MYQELETECNRLPLLNMVEYLAGVLDKTENQRRLLQNECRCTEDIFSQRSVMTLTSSHNNDQARHLESIKINSPYAQVHSTSKYKAECKSKLNSTQNCYSAVNNIYKQNKGTSIRINTIKPACNRLKTSKVNAKENNLKNDGISVNKTVNSLTKQKYPLTTCKRIDVKKESRKDYSEQHNISKPSPEHSSSNNSINDKVESITVGLAKSVIKKSPGKRSEIAVTKRNSISNMIRHTFITFPQAISSSNFKYHKDLIKTFNLHKKLQCATNTGITKNMVAVNFITKLNERNKYCLQSPKNKFDECSKWMKMKSRCTAKQDFQNEQIPFFKWETHQSVTGTVTSKMFIGQKSQSEQLILEMHYTEFLFLQLELLNKLNQDVSKLCHTTLFFKAWKTLLNVLPIRIVI